VLPRVVKKSIPYYRTLPLVAVVSACRNGPDYDSTVAMTCAENIMPVAVVLGVSGERTVDISMPAIGNRARAVAGTLIPACLPLLHGHLHYRKLANIHGPETDEFTIVLKEIYPQFVGFRHVYLMNLTL
jgi:hypothetical protein